MSNRKTRKSSKGNTMALVLIAISFIVIISTVAIFTAYTNYLRKAWNLKNKQTFYTAESVVDEVYTGMGMEAMNQFSNAYVYTLSNLNGFNQFGQLQNMTDAEANKVMKQRYILRLMEELCGKRDNGEYYFDEKNFNSDTTSYSFASNSQGFKHITAKLSSYIAAPDNAQVNSVGMITVKHNAGTDTYSIVIKDVNIKYKEKDDNYFAELTIDLNLSYPNIDVVFNTEQKKGLDNFKNYCLIGSTGVRFDSNANVNVLGGVFAGNHSMATGITTTGGMVIRDANVTFSDGIGAIVSSGNIDISNKGQKVKVEFNDCEIWANNIKVNTDVSGVPSTGTNNIVSISNSKTYLSDDFEVNADYSDVTLGGDFWGYGMNSLAHNGASAIIMNGKASALNVDVKNLLVAGKAYIAYGDGDDKEILTSTAESVGIRGNQRYYIVPDKYIECYYTDTKGVEHHIENLAQPFRIPADLAEGAGKIRFQLKDEAEFKNTFFGVMYLSDTEMLTAIHDGKYYNVYLNFATNSAANSYLRCLVDRDFYVKERNAYTNNATVRNAFDVSRDEGMVPLTLQYLQSINSVVNVSANGNVYSTALLLNYSGDNVSMDSASSSDALNGLLGDQVTGNTSDLFAVTMNNNINVRYEVLKRVLLSLPETENGKYKYYGQYTPGDQSTLPSAFTINGQYYEIEAGMYDKTPFNNIINTTLLNNDMDDKSDVQYALDSSNNIHNSHREFVYIGSKDNGDLANIVIDKPSYGVIVTTGDVTVKSSFVGLIIADGKITVSGSGTISNNISGIDSNYSDMAAYIEMSNNGKIAKYFNAFYVETGLGESNDDEMTIDKVKFTDLVTYSNWRKTVGE